MLDVHIAVSADTPSDWVRQSIASVEACARAAPFRVELHVVKGVPGNIGAARAAGYACGNQPYATYVDDDDYVLPGAFAVIHAALLASPAAIFTGETRLQNDRLVPGSPRHHLAVYRRDVIAGFDWPAWKVAGDIATKRIAEAHADGVVDVSDRVYVNRVYWDSKARTMRRDLQTEVAEAEAHGK